MDKDGNPLEGYQNKECAAYRLMSDNDGERAHCLEVPAQEGRPVAHIHPQRQRQEDAERMEEEELMRVERVGVSLVHERGRSDLGCGGKVVVPQPRPDRPDSLTTPDRPDSA